MKLIELLRQRSPFFVQVRTTDTKEHKASVELRQDRGIMKQELIIPESEYNKLLSSIDEVWNTAKTNAALAVNTQLLDANT